MYLTKYVKNYFEAWQSKTLNPKNECQVREPKITICKLCKVLLNSNLFNDLSFRPRIYKGRIDRDSYHTM